MVVTDPIADMFTRMRNACKAGHDEVSMPSSNMKVAVAQVLKDSGYVLDYRVEDADTVKKKLVVALKYMGGRKRKPVIEAIKRISKPSCRVYVGSKDIPRVLGGLGMAVLSTSNGVMTGEDARQGNIGGEVLGYVW